mmetsp:Transcript_15030/g.21272  ORF Transcript_15030/g.21272 Transcript_15030/m.21272 type:complete len:316 (+) Transcript_15030:178-1125(+)
MKLALASFLLAINPSTAFTSVQTSGGITSTTTTSRLWAENNNNNGNNARRQLLSNAAAAVATGSLLVTPSVAFADAAAIQDSLDIQNFLRTGVDAGGPMGVSSQAGKSRPQTGVVLRDGSDVSQDTRTGDVLAEILTGTKAKPVAVLASFQSPWALQTGPVFDVECRDGKSGDGAFLAVSKSVGGKKLDELPSSFFLERLFDPTGRFSFYGPPTDVKVKSSKMVDGGNKRILDITFSILSQSTNAEIGRRALLVATIPEGTDNAVMLTASGLERRWKKEVEGPANKTIDSFRAIPAPKTSLKLRAKDRSYGQLDF